MFGGTERRRSSNVRYKQLFHELKQQFPTIADDVIASCIFEQAGNINVKKHPKIIEVLKKVSVSGNSPSEDHMGRSSSQCEVPILDQLENTLNSPESTAESIASKKTSDSSHKHHKKSSKGSRKESEVSETDGGERRKEKRGKISGLLKKSTRIHKGLEEKLQSKKHKTVRVKEGESSSSRETTPSSDQEETSVDKTKHKSHKINKKRSKSVPAKSSTSKETTPTSDQEVTKVKKTTRGYKISEQKFHPKKHSKFYLKETEDSSRETTPFSDPEEVEVAPTVSTLRQQFESTSNENVNNSVPFKPKPKLKTPPRDSEMDKNVPASADLNQNKPLINASPKRPTSLALNTPKPDDRVWGNTIQPSERCKNLPKLLNANLLNDKPPRSPVHNKKIVNSKIKNVSKNASSPCSDKEDVKDTCNASTGARKKETVSTPTQTTDTLLSDTASGGVNLSFNVNCSMDVIRSPLTPRRTSTIQLTPETPWLQEPTSPRSYTSVNLTLRPPSSTPQPPIDITSQNSSLTYSTSSFDSQKGLQSRLQITVSPGGGCVTASRIRPASCEFDTTETKKLDVPVIGSPKEMVEREQPPVIIKQQARIERLRIELTNEKTRLVVLKKEVGDLENKTGLSFAEVQRQELKLKIDHLRYQCRKLVQDLNDFSEPEFYNNLYRGQPLDVNGNRLNSRMRMPNLQQDPDGPKWSCHICTFLNHPELNKCEQCEMPRLIHGRIFPMLGNMNLPNNNHLRLQN